MWQPAPSPRHTLHNAARCNTDAAPLPLPPTPCVLHCRCDLGTRNFRTIMSYGCLNNQNAPTIDLFSSPALTWNGVPAGTSGSNDCARMLRETSARVASARNTVVTGGSGGSITTGLSSTKCVDAPSFNSGTQVCGWAALLRTC